MDVTILSASSLQLPNLSKYEWWTLFGILGLIVGMLPRENLLFLRRILLILCLGWIIIYLPIRINKEIKDVLLFYSLPQLLFFLIPYRLADYFVKSEFFKARIKLKKDLEFQIRNEFEDKYPNIRNASFEIINGIEHVSEREKALENSTNSLVIASGWVSKYVINKNFISKLQGLINNGVKIRIIYGYKDKQGNHSSDKVSVELLNELQKKNKKGDVKILFKANHSKIIVVDNKYALCGSFNWLSNSRALNREISFKTYDKNVISDINKNIKDIANN